MHSHKSGRLIEVLICTLMITVMAMGMASLTGCAAKPSPSPGEQTAVKVAGKTGPPQSMAIAEKPLPPQQVVAGPNDWFEEMTTQAGISFAYQNGRDAGQFLMIESFGGGVAVIDYDLDDTVDLFFTGGGTISRDAPVQIHGLPSALFRNQGDWRFQPVTTESGLALPPDYSQGCAVSDINGDGFPDLFICCYGLSRLYTNAGDGTFFEATDEQQLPATGWGTAAAFGDWDGDGWPDLFLTSYTNWTPATDVPCFGSQHERDLCGPTSYPATTSHFYHNLGDGSFEDWSEKLQLIDTAHGLGVVCTDLNRDGWIDFYISSDALPNHLYLGGPGKSFVDSAMTAGVAVGEWGQPEASMGIDVADYDGDGWPDLFVTNFEKEDHSLYRNLGGGLWIHASVATGLSATSRRRVGFGTSFCDFDGDHWPDLFVLNGNPIYTTAESPFAQKPQLFRNLNGKKFVEVFEQSGPYFQEAHSGRGSAVADLDNDGDFDLITVLINEPVHLQRNRLEKRPTLCLKLCAVQGDRDGVGARVSCVTSGREWSQWVTHGGSYFSQSDSRIIFPVEAAERAVAVTVAWPGRQSEVFTVNVTPDGQTQRLIEGRGSRQHESP